MPIEKGIVEYYGSIGSEHKCGYCKKNKPPLCDFGMWGHQLTPFEYFNLMERGWRRSGKYLYKPINEKTCCPTYPIKCDVLNFVPSKSQKRVIRNMNRFLMDDVKPKHYDKSDGGDDVNSTSRVKANDSVRTKSMEVERRTSRDKLSKKKSIRMETAINKIMVKNECDRETAINIAKEKHNLKLNNRIQSKVKQLEELLKLPDDREPKHRLKISFVSTSFTHNKTAEAEYIANVMPQEHAVYVKYQTVIHKDDPNECTPKQFQRFLVDSPLIPVKLKKPIDVNDISNYGSYHMQFWLDETILIAVGVVDFVTLGWSSVYFFYDPDYRFLTLGTYSALREVAMVRSIVKRMPEYKNYFMGYYIHSCPKMRYKGKFKPSYLLCPEVKTWWPLNDIRAKLDQSKYCRLDPDPNAPDENAQNISQSDIEVLYSTNGMTTFDFYLTLKQSGENDDDEDGPTSENELEKIIAKVEEYSKLAGKPAVKSILLYLD